MSWADGSDVFPVATKFEGAFRTRKTIAWTESSEVVTLMALTPLVVCYIYLSFAGNAFLYGVHVYRGLYGGRGHGQQDNHPMSGYLVVKDVREIRPGN